MESPIRGGFFLMDLKQIIEELELSITEIKKLLQDEE